MCLKRIGIVFERFTEELSVSSILRKIGQDFLCLSFEETRNELYNCTEGFIHLPLSIDSAGHYKQILPLANQFP